MTQGDGWSLDRRRMVGILTAAGLAGCNDQGTTATRTETATDSATRTQTDQPTETATPTAEPTEPPSAIVFDGGGAAAFSAALDRLRETAADTLRVTAGTHRLDASQAPSYDYPRDDVRVHVDGTGLDGVTIAGPPPGEGTAEIVLEDPTRGFVLFRNAAGAVATDRPSGPVVRDLTVRHDPLAHTQGVIAGLSADRTAITLDLASGYPSLDDPPFAGEHPPDRIWASVFTAEGDRVSRAVTGPDGRIEQRETTGDRSNFKEIESLERVGDRRFRLGLADGLEPGGLRVGRRLAIMAWHGDASVFNHADRLQPTYERVTVRSSAYRCFNFNACDRPQIRACVVTPARDDRLISTNADVIHCNNCPRGPAVEGCLVTHNSDDTVVADNELLSVSSVESDRRVRVTASFGTRVGRGDRLTAATPRLDRLGELPPVAEVDERGGPATTEPVNPESITFQEPLPATVETGTILTGGRMRNRETVVRNNEFRSVRARYVRSGGTDGLLVADNTFVGTHGDGVEIEARADTGPGVSDLKGWSEDVTIRNNRIEQTGLAGIPSGLPRAVTVGVDAGEPPSEPAVSGRPHRRVTVEGNEIHDTAAVGIEVADAREVRLADNRIVEPGRIPGIAQGAYGIGLANVADASVTGTRVVVRADDLNGFGWRRGSRRVATSDNEYLVAGDSREPTLDRLE